MNRAVAAEQVMEIVATLLLLSIGAIYCDDRGNVASIVLVDNGRTSENISFAGNDQLDYTLHLKSEVKHSIILSSSAASYYGLSRVFIHEAPQ